MAGQDNIALRHPVWHDTCGGCHSSPAPSGLVALSRESIRWVNLLNVYFKMTCKSVRWRKVQFEGPHLRVSSNKILQKYDNPLSHDVVTLLSAQNLSDSNFPEAALRLSRLQFAGLPTPRDTEASNAYALMHDALGPVCICSVIGINLNGILASRPARLPGT